MKNLIFLFLFFILTFSVPVQLSYTECEIGTIIMTQSSGAFLEISPPGLVCGAGLAQTVQAGWSYQTWCLTLSSTGTGVIWNTVFQQYLGVDLVGAVYGLTLSSTFNPSIHEWTITAIPYVAFGTLSQRKADGNTYALSQTVNSNGGGAVTATSFVPVGVKILNPSDITQSWYLGGLARDPASPSPLATCTVNIESVQYPNTFLRAGSGGIVNLQYTADGNEKWTIEYNGQLDINDHQIFCLQNNKFSSYLTFDTNPDCSTHGCLTAACGPQEMMVFNTDVSGNLVIQSVYNEAMFLNLNGNGLTQPEGNGGGVVSWQTSSSGVTIQAA